MLKVKDSFYDFHVFTVSFCFQAPFPLMLSCPPAKQLSLLCFYVNMPTNLGTFSNLIISACVCVCQHFSFHVSSLPKSTERLNQNSLPRLRVIICSSFFTKQSQMRKKKQKQKNQLTLLSTCICYFYLKLIYKIVLIK